MPEWNGEERRRFERRCQWPNCGSSQKLNEQHEEIKDLLKEIKSGQKDLFEVAKKQIGVLTKIETMEKDIQDLKTSVETKVSKKDALVGGSIVGGVLMVIQFIYWLHDHWK